MDNVPGWAYVVGGPLWLWAFIGLANLFRQSPNLWAMWNERKRDAADIEGSQVARMDARMLRLEERLNAAELAHAECLEHLQEERDGRAAEHAGRLEAEALLMARQRVDQAVQVRVSAEREVDAAGRGAARAADRAAGAAEEREREEGAGGD